MILKELLNSLTDQDIIARLHTLYYNDEPDYDLTGYRHVLATLRAIEPTSSDITIIVQEYHEDWGKGPETSICVDGIDSAGERWAIEFRPWSEWLGSEVDDMSLYGFGELDFMAHCLWEMTFMGYKEEKIQETWNEILNAKKDVEENGVENTCKLLRDVV